VTDKTLSVATVTINDGASGNNSVSAAGDTSASKNKTLTYEPLAKLSARVREFPARITTLDRKLVISSDSRPICRRATNFQSFQASR
jgi:hypothetical protein